MVKKNEKNVFELHVPSCAVVKKAIYTEQGFVAAALKCGENEITYFRTDFLSLERVAWDCNEVLDRGFHDDIPDEIIESIEKNKGFFISRNPLSINPKGKVVSKEHLAIEGMSFARAEKIVRKFNISQMESSVPYGLIYDLIGKWLIQTKTLTEEEWLWSPTSEEEQKTIMNKDHGGWKLEDLITDIFSTEWTKEYFFDRNITRDGVPFSDGEANYPARKRYMYSKGFNHPDAKVRAFLYFK